MSTATPQPEQPHNPSTQPTHRFDPQLTCEHRFYLMAPSLVQAPKRGEQIWFYCERCLLTIEKEVKDQSDKL